MLVTTLERLLYVTTMSFKPSKTFTKSFLEGLMAPSVENNCEITCPLVWLEKRIVHNTVLGTGLPTVACYNNCM